MKQSKKSRKNFRDRRSSSAGIAMEKGKGGRSELRYKKQPGSGLPSSMQTETYQRGCSIDLWPLRMTLISLLGAKGYVKLITGERSLPFSPAFTYAFFSELNAIRKRASKSLKEKRYKRGKKMAGCMMSKSYGTQRKKDTKSARSK